MILKKRLLIMLLALSSSMFYVTAQSVVPYTCGFETEQERNDWTCVESGKVKLTGFRKGSAMKSTGNYAMYTSADDGASANYELMGTGHVSIAYHKFNLEKGQHQLSFDLKSRAELLERDVMLYVALIPEEKVADVNKLANRVTAINPLITDNAVWVSGEYYKKWTGWNSEFANIAVKTAGNYYLVFAVKIEGISNTSRQGICRPERFGFCIDNIQLNKSPNWGECNMRITNFKVEKDSDGIKLSWEGKSDSYDIMYYKINQPADWEVKTNIIAGVQGSKTGPSEYRFDYNDLEKGVYSFRVRSNCGEGNIGSPWALQSSILVYDPTEYCIDYLNLTSEKTVTTTGDYSNPTRTRAYIDYGYESRQSYHTVHWDTAEYDPVTQYKLRTVKPGHFASTRIGIATDGDNLLASSITYEYDVPLDADLFLLNYAPVIQFADHHPEGDQTQVEVNILDAFTGGILETPCLHHYFNAMPLKQDMVLGKADLGWQSWKPDGYGEWCGPGEEIIWHDWMVMGFDVSRYRGQTIKVQVQLAPCAAYFHFAYIYIIPECASADIDGMSCDAKATELSVPEGFRYRWYKTDDPRRTVVCEENVFRPEPEDTSSYYIDMISLDYDECYFTLKAHILPRKPTPVPEYKQVPIDCMNQIQFDGTKSRINVVNDGNVSDPGAGEHISEYLWVTDDYGTLRGDRPVLTVPNEGDTFNVTLVCRYAGCEASQDFMVYAPSIVPPQNTMYCCAGDQLWIDGEYRQFDDNDTIMLLNRTMSGCDSMIVVNVIKPVVVDTTIECRSDELPFYFKTDLVEYDRPFETSGSYIVKVPSKIKPSCDTLHYNINFVVKAMLEVQIGTMPEICSGDESFTLPFMVVYGSYDALYIDFGDLAEAAGFSADGGFLFDKETSTITISLPENVRPDFYSATLVFVNEKYGDLQIPIEFTVLYSRDVMTQRWNDVIALQNKENNGGYEFSGYQWYLNDEVVEGHTLAIYYNDGEELDFEGEYRMLLTRIDDGKSIMTCAFTPVRFNEDEYNEVGAVIFGREPINAEVQRRSVAYLYDLAGVLHAVWQFEPGVNVLQRPENNGVYLLKLVYEDGTVEIHKVVVQ